MAPTPADAPAPTATHRNTNWMNGECGDRNIYICHPGIVIGIVAAVIIGCTFFWYIFRALRQAHESHAWKEDLAYRIWKVNQYTIPRKQKDTTTIGQPAPPPADNVELVESSNISSDEIGTPDGKPTKAHHDVEHGTVPVQASTSHHVRFSET